MKTFTTYAEKKAKQILNLLQGYTKGIRITAILILLLMGVNSAWAATFSGGEILVLKPNSNWTKDGARFAAYFFGNGDKWVSMSAVTINGTSGYYQVTAPTGGYTQVIFCRMNGSAAANNWNNKWNQSGDLTYDGKKNVFTVPSGAWDGSTSSWGNITIAVTLDAQSGTGGTESVDVNYGEDERPTVTAPTRTGYDFGGFYTSTGGGGSQVINSSNAWQKNISNYVDANGRWIKNAACTLYAKWTEKTYSVSISAGTGGTVSPSGSKTIGQVTKTTVTATPNTNYEFVNWEATGGVVVANTSSASTTITATAAGTLTAHFRSTATYHLDVQAGNGISQVGGAVNDITLGEKFAIKATPKTGYTFNEWTANPAANAEFADARSENTTVTVKNGSVTVTATGKEQLYALTTANSYSTGNPGYTSPTKSRNDIGVETAAEVTSTAASADYIFTGWTLTNCERTDGGADNAATITIRANGNGDAKVVANYTAKTLVRLYYYNNNNWSKINAYLWKDGSGSDNNGWPGTEITNNVEVIDCEKYYYYEYYKEDHPDWNRIIFNNGSNQTSDITFSNSTNNGQFSINNAWVASPGPKWTLAGTMNEWNTDLNPLICSDATSGYVELQLTANTDYEFKFVDKHNDKWYGVSSTVTQITYTNQATARTMNGNNNANNQTIRTAGAGVYRFTWDVTNKKVTVTYPTSYTVTYSRTPTAAADAPTTDPSITSGKYVAADTKVKFTAKTAKTGYTFKGWYDNNKGTGAALSTNLEYTCTINANTTIYAVYTAHTYDVTIDADPAEAAATLTSSPQAVGILPVEISTTANAGYKFKEWTATAGITIKQATSSTTTITATQAGTVTAHFIPVQPTTVYFKPIDDWKGDKIRFAVYYWDEFDNHGWVNMEDVGCTGEYFKAVVPGGYPNIKFVSFPTDKDNNWDYDINGTENLTVPTDENVLYDMGTTSANKLYLKPNDKWENESNERYAAYFFGNGDKWVDMTSSTTLSGHYECNKQPDYPNIIFVRMNGDNATNDWNSKWTQTNDLTIPTNGDNIFTIADNAVTSQNADGYWSAGDNSQWTTFTEPTYSITLKANPHGTYTIAYAGETATSKTTEDVVIDKLPINTTITFTENAPQDGWALEDMSITANGETDDNVALTESYVMCSDVTITPQFVSAVPQVVYLKTSAWNSDSPKWVAHAFNNSDSEDVDLTAITTCTDQPEFYQCTIPAGYHSLVFYRKKGDGSEIWNQTADLTLPVKSDKNYYTFDNGGDDSKWSTNNHTYDVQVTASGGTITIIYDGTPIAVTNASEIITLPVNAEIKVDFSDAVPGYIAKDPSIKIGNKEVATTAGAYTICGPTTISTGFVTERPHTVYLAPTYRWNADHAKFAVYAFDNKGKGQWIEMKTVAAGSCDNTYFVCEIPAGMTAFSFVRLKPDGGLDWESKWNQTNDLTIPVDGNNCYTITAMGESKSAGKWGVYVEQTSFQVTLLPTLDGTITVEYNGTTTTSSPGQDVVLNVEKDATIVLTFTPNENYKLASTSIIIGTNNEETAIAGQAYTICGATTIAAHFISTLNLQTIYLRPNDDWLKDAPIFAAYFYDSNNTETYEWIEMKTEKTDYTGSYSCQVSQHYDHVVFVRINPNGDQPFNNGINWENAWNQTKSLGITSDIVDQYGYRFAIGDKITQEGEDKNRYDGHWEQNTPIWSVRGQFNNWNVDATVLRGYEGKAKLKLNANSEYHFKLYNHFGGNDDWQKWYGLSTNAQAVTIDRTNYDTWRGMSTYDGSANNILKTDHEGVYVFKLQYKTTGSDNNKTLNKNLKVVFPTSAYRLAYMEEGKPETFRLSRYIEYIDEDSQIDTVSFFVDITKSPYIYILQGLDITNLDTIAMHHIAEGIDGDGENPGEAMLPNRRNAGGELHIGSGCGVKENYVYNFMLQQTNEPAQEPVHEATLLAKETHKYEGDYYIRTDGAEGGWNNYLQEGNKMTYFVYRPQQGEKYNHYWVASVRHSDDNNKVNVKARIANLYSDHLAIELAEDKSTDEYGDVYIKDPNGKKEKVNLRFGYNPSTNFFERAMLTGSGNNNQFLNITSGNTTIFLDSLQQKRLDYADKQSKFTDISNWVYEKDVWIPVATTADSITVKLSAKQYNDTTTHLFGYKEDGVTPAERVIIGTGTTPNSYKMRVIYDFKVNRIIMAWIPGTQNLTEDINLNANILFIRHENDVVPQLNTNGQNIIGIQHQYFSMEFESKGKEDNHEEHYWFSLPFDCVVGSITGVHGYMDIWGIQRYNGKKRAEIGWFAETATFWEWLTPNDTLRAGEGYVLSFAKELATWNNYDVFDDNENYLKTLSILRLYFPAIETGFDFQTKDSLVVTYPNEPCTIELDERYKQDGNWKIIGSTSYNNVCAAADIKTHEDSVWHPEGYEWSAPKFRYSYTYDNSSTHNRKTKCKYVPENGKDASYNSFYGYMVQFAGTVKWKGFTQTIPRSVAARKNSSAENTTYTTCLELVDNTGYEHDRTFVALDEEATIYNDLNKDLCKVFNSYCAQLYTTADDVNYAGNTLPMEKVTVPVGVVVKEVGEYTFRMPDGTDGISAILVDNQTGAHTNMLLDEYTVILEAGTYENRFSLVLDPQRTSTEVENIGDGYGDGVNGNGTEGIKKYIIDGQLFIRTANGLFDAKGQRL